MTAADPNLTSVLQSLAPGKALDLAAGGGRHSEWLRDRRWTVTAVDQTAPEVENVNCIQADLEKHEYRIVPNSWDLIVCWLYWQPDLLPEIAAGVRTGGVVAIAGKTTGRFATSLGNFSAAFAGWEEMKSGEDEARAFFIARKKLVD